MSAVHQADLDWVAGEFDRCWPWLKDAVDCYGDTHSKADVWRKIKRKKAQLWPKPDAAIITEIEVHPKGWKELRWWLAGGDLGQLCASVPAIEQFARDRRCKRAAIIGREGWLRVLPGYSKRAVIMTKDLD